MDDLIVFLRARLDEDEQVALDWQRHKEALTERFMNDPSRKHVRLRREPVTDARLSEYAYHDRFDPARVLRGVAARRAAIEEYAYLHKRALNPGPHPQPDEAGRFEVAAIMTRALAAEWSDHPDYYEGWRTDG
jgi:hypothetical protein